MTTTKKFRIGELSKHIQVEKFVVRFWEKEFKLEPHRSSGGQRFYTDKDVEFFSQIKKLLYEEGFTIAGARKYLENICERGIITASKTQMKNQDSAQNQLAEYIIAIQKKLLKLRDLL
jgi:DNA-binding transcriptional MerR regulator